MQLTEDFIREQRCSISFFACTLSELINEQLRAADETTLELFSHHKNTRKEHLAKDTGKVSLTFLLKTSLPILKRGLRYCAWGLAAKRMDMTYDISGGSISYCKKESLKLYV